MEGARQPEHALAGDLAAARALARRERHEIGVEAQALVDLPRLQEAVRLVAGGRRAPRRQDQPGLEGQLGIDDRVAGEVETPRRGRELEQPLLRRLRAEHQSGAVAEDAAQPAHLLPRAG